MSEFHHISPTAWIVAKIRANYSNIEMSKELFQEINKHYSPWTMSMAYNILQLLAKINPKKSSAIMIPELRYNAINSILPKDGNFVLVEVASGVSPRCLGMAKKGVLSIESDLPGLQSYKRKVIDAISTDRSHEDHLHLVPANVLQPDDLDAIGEVYKKYGKNRPLYLVHEGLMMYLSDEEKETLRNNIATFFKKYAPNNAYWISPDFNPLKDKKAKIQGPLEFITKIMEKVAKRSMKTFLDEDDINAYVQKSDLVANKIPNQHLFSDLASMDKLNLSMGDIPSLVQNYSAYIVKTRETP